MRYIDFDALPLNTEVEIAGFKFSWLDVDYLQITDKYGHKRKICGGDFECLITALLGVEMIEEQQG